MGLFLPLHRQHRRARSRKAVRPPTPANHDADDAAQNMPKFQTYEWAAHQSALLAAGLSISTKGQFFTDLQVCTL